MTAEDGALGLTVGELIARKRECGEFTTEDVPPGTWRQLRLADVPEEAKRGKTVGEVFDEQHEAHGEDLAEGPDVNDGPMLLMQVDTDSVRFDEAGRLAGMVESSVMFVRNDPEEGGADEEE